MGWQITCSVLDCRVTDPRTDPGETHWVDASVQQLIRVCCTKRACWIDAFAASGEIDWVKISFLSAIIDIVCGPVCPFGFPAKYRNSGWLIFSLPPLYFLFRRAFPLGFPATARSRTRRARYFSQRWWLPKRFLIWKAVSLVFDLGRNTQWACPQTYFCTDRRSNTSSSWIGILLSMKHKKQVLELKILESKTTSPIELRWYFEQWTETVICPNLSLNPLPWWFWKIAVTAARLCEETGKLRRNTRAGGMMFRTGTVKVLLAY